MIVRLRAAGCVFAEDEAALLIAAARTPAALTAMVDRRVEGLPLEQILGWAQFCGLRIVVESGVFVPRRRTEFLARRAAALAREAGRAADRDLTRSPVVVLDMCCGSGAVGAAVLAAVDGVEMYAVDIDPVAVHCARRNIRPPGRVYQGDLAEPLPGRLVGQVDVMVANAPYVPTEAIGTMPPEARTHEPLLALDGGADGLDIQRRVTALAPRWLAPGGRLLIETSERQAPLTMGIFASHGLAPVLARSAELDATVVIGRRESGIAPRRRPR